MKGAENVDRGVFMSGSPRIASVLGSVLMWAGFAAAQAPSPPSAVAALEEALVDVVAEASRSVVAISQVRKRTPGESLNF